MDIRAIIFTVLSLWIVVIPCLTFLLPLFMMYRKRTKIKRKYFENLFRDCFSILVHGGEDILCEIFGVSLSPLIESYDGYIISNNHITLKIYKIESDQDTLYWRIYDNETDTEIDNDQYCLNDSFYYTFFNNKEIYREIQYMFESIKITGKEITKITV